MSVAEIIKRRWLNKVRSWSAGGTTLLQKSECLEITHWENFSL